MIPNIQETKDRIVFSSQEPVTFGSTHNSPYEIYGKNWWPWTLSSGLPKTWQARSIPDETYGKYWTFPAEGFYFRRFGSLIRGLEDKEKADKAKRLLSSIDKTVQALEPYLSFLPELEARVPDDGSVLFEWIVEDYRVGFNVEPEAKESSWYLITKSNLGDITASGLLVDNDLDQLILWLLIFIFFHS